MEAVSEREEVIEMAGRDIERRTTEEIVKGVVRRLARQAPALADLSAEDLLKLGRIVTAEALKDDLAQRVKLERVDWTGEQDRYLSRTRSAHTRRAYKTALSRLDEWCTRQGIAPAALTPAQSDDYIESEKAAGGSPATVRLRVSACSAFYTWLERRHPEVRSPFRGTRSRPAQRAVRKLAVPTGAEIDVIEGAAKDVGKLDTWAAIVTMRHTGLRVGALPYLSISGERWTTTTKGSEQRGRVPEVVRRAIERAGLSLRSPFAGLSGHSIADRVRHLTVKLEAEGKLQHVYSVHDLRHHYAVTMYQNTRDLYAVRRALGHTNTTTTERYLRSLDVDTDGSER